MPTDAQKPVVVITGSAGLIGSRLVSALTPSFMVIGLDVKPPASKREGSEFISCDMTKDESVESAFQKILARHGPRLASVIHLAAYYDFSGEPSPLYQELTVNGTRRLVKALRPFQVEQLVFSSSLLVMKPVEEKGEIITEESQTEGSWDYPRSKLAAEGVLARERGQIPVVILRIAGVYDDEGHSIPITQQISRIYEKKLESYFFPGNATHGQPFVHLDDLVECFRRVIDLRRELEPSELFLIAEPDILSYRDLQEQIGELVHEKEWPTIRIPKPLAKAGAWVQEKLAGDDEETFIKPWMIDLADAHCPAETERARERLGWRPKHKLSKSLPFIVHSLGKDPRAWYERNKLPLPDELKPAPRTPHRDTAAEVHP